MAQWYAQVDGKQYGPVSEEDMRSWVGQGRIKQTDYVWSEGMPNWVPAGTIFSAAVAASPPSYSPYVAHGAPHRGSTVLVLGILSLVLLCLGLILGPIAWSMGNRDSREMAAGRMDRSGESMTKAGRICGIIGTILGILWGIYFVVIVAITVSVASHRSTYSPSRYSPSDLLGLADFVRAMVGL